MTQGEVLSAFAPIETFFEICEERKIRINEYMSTGDVDMMMPFVKKAQEAAEKISRFALDNVNSEDKKIRGIINKIDIRLSGYAFRHFPNFKGSDVIIDWLNNNIKGVTNQIDNTYRYLAAFDDEPENTDSRLEELEAENKRLSEKTKELESENQQLISTTPVQIEDEKLKNEVKRLEQKMEDMIIELLLPIFYKNKQDVKDFLKEIDGRQDIEIIDTVHDFVKARKISDKSKNRPLWMVLHAAKYYRSTESNWNSALKNHP